MPSGPPELHAEFQADMNAVNYLESQGFKLLPSAHWLPPPFYEITEKDNRAISYLILEWDYGGIHPGHS